MGNRSLIVRLGKFVSSVIVAIGMLAMHSTPAVAAHCVDASHDEATTTVMHDHGIPNVPIVDEPTCDEDGTHGCVGMVRKSDSEDGQNAALLVSGDALVPSAIELAGWRAVGQQAERRKPSLHLLSISRT